MATHLAAVLPSQAKGSLSIESRPTPTPSPKEVLIEVSSVALNPIDLYQRSRGFPPIATYPTVLGSDITGTIIGSGSDNPLFPIGTRVSAFASGFFKQNNPDYGSFQKKLIVATTTVVPLPDAVSFNEGALLPMQWATTWGAWYTIGIDRDTKYGPSDKKGMLIWGGSSSIGSAAVQLAKLMGFVTYVTASPKHHAYLKTLGAEKLFDYNSDTVVEDVVKAAKADGVTIDVGHHFVRYQLELSQQILQKAKGGEKALLVSAMPLTDESPKADGVETKFMLPPAEPEAREEYYAWVFNVWLKGKLESGEVVPSPHIQVVGKGLESVDKGLDILEEGVSCVKLVIEI